jgi:hypothetical protein
MSIEANETVALVLILDYGQRLSELCLRADVWAVESPSNREAATEIWNRLAQGEHSPMTVFDCAPDEAPGDTVLRMLDTIEEHHPNCATIEFCGAKPLPPLVSELQTRGYLHNMATNDGFVASKHAL